MPNIDLSKNKFTISDLTEADIFMIGGKLGELPFKQVAPLIDRLQKQYEAQKEAYAAAAEAAAAPKAPDAPQAAADSASKPQGSRRRAAPQADTGAGA